MIYTKKGDDGTTSLADGCRVLKDSPRVEAYGTVDELGAHIALLIELIQTTAPDEALFLQQVQQELFVVQSRLATADMEAMRHMPLLNPEATSRIEKQIDSITAAIPPMKAFVIPGGSIASSQCHVCRTVCRRAERRIVSLAKECDEQQLAELVPIRQYINRLSDLLFVMARKIVLAEGKKEIFWLPA